MIDLTAYKRLARPLTYLFFYKMKEKEMMTSSVNLDLGTLRNDFDLSLLPGCIPFRTETCSSHHYLFGCYTYWCDAIKEPPRYHRKQWEFVYIAQALSERGFLKSGMKGLGFGVGREPLVAVFASLGCAITATDMQAEQAHQAGWTLTNQYSKNLSDLNARGICTDDIFEKSVSFESVDMNHIPAHLLDYDFCWSACCFEHLGDIKKGLCFVKNSLDTIKSGGVSIHTTEFNLSSNLDTVEKGSTVLFRESDIDMLISELTELGHSVEPFIIHKGSQPIDDFVDIPPYCGDLHLKCQIKQYVVTSIGLIIRKDGGVTSNALDFRNDSLDIFEAGKEPLRMSDSNYIVNSENILCAVMGKSQPGHMTFGPYKKYKKGFHEIDFLVRSSSPIGKVATIDVFDCKGNRILASKDILASDMKPNNGWTKVVLSINVINDDNSLEFRTYWHGSTDFDISAIYVR